MIRYASQGQINLMKSLGLDFPENCTMDMAKEIISKKIPPKPQFAQPIQPPAKVLPPSDSPAGVSEKDKLIIRQSSMNRAVELVVSKDITIESMFNLAEDIEKWVLR